MTDFRQIEEIAALWVVKEDRGLSESERLAFEKWLDESDAHHIACLRLSSAWEDVDRLAVLKVPLTEAQRPKRNRLAFPRWKALMAAIAAPIILCVGTLILVLHPVPENDRIATGIGQSRVVKLADGTRVQLNTDTTIRMRMTPSYRAVTLDHGEVYLDVVHDSKRPFVVLAGNRRITDLGTRFSVYRNHDHVEVVVQEGRVRVDAVNTPAAGLPVFAHGGNTITADEDEALVATKPSQEIANELDWRNGMLVFNQETLSDAAAEFNRYNTRHLIVGKDAGDIRIGGSFKAQNIDAFAALAQESFGLRVEKKGDSIFISK